MPSSEKSELDADAKARPSGVSIKARRPIPRESSRSTLSTFLFRTEIFSPTSLTASASASMAPDFPAISTRRLAISFMSPVFLSLEWFMNLFLQQPFHQSSGLAARHRPVPIVHLFRRFQHRGQVPDHCRSWRLL